MTATVMRKSKVDSRAESGHTKLAKQTSRSIYGEHRFSMLAAKGCEWQPGKA
jgi:hypothetical protein